MIFIFLFSALVEAKLGFFPSSLNEAELESTIPLLYCMADRLNTDWELVHQEGSNPLLKVYRKEDSLFLDWIKDGERKTFPLKETNGDDLCLALTPLVLAPKVEAISLPESPPPERKIKPWHWAMGAAVVGIGAYLLLKPRTFSHSSVVLE